MNPYKLDNHSVFSIFSSNSQYDLWYHPRKLHINHFLYKVIKEFVALFHNIGSWFPILFLHLFFGFVFCSKIRGANTWIPSAGIKLLLLCERCHNLFVAEFVLESGQILANLSLFFEYKLWFMFVISLSKHIERCCLWSTGCIVRNKMRVITTNIDMYGKIKRIYVR